MPLIEPRPSAPLIALSSDFIRAKEYFEAIVASSGDMICTTDVRGRVLYFSPGAEAMLGVPATSAVGRPAHDFYARGREDAAQLMRLLRDSHDGRTRNYEMQLRASGERLLTVSMSVSLLKDARGRVIGTLGVAKDISDRAELERRLREMTRTDDLTGLFNQRHFYERLREEAARARRQKRRLSLILFDLDGFKQVNDRLGHLAGDRILRLFAKAVADRVRREVDLAFRWGGDEFVVLLPETGAAGAARIAKRIAAAARSLGREGVSASWGVAELSPSGRADALVRRADAAMFKMKSAGSLDRRDR
ncbi:MAG: diguanylate cyclase [Elusimicrobia bacterium]|nr:diguanylate cyclase [Elusimicrobiota bacterium]